MQIKRYLAADMRQALKRVREEQGPDAVILSSRRRPEGLEVVAAVEYDESLIDLSLQRKPGEGPDQHPGLARGGDGHAGTAGEPDGASLTRMRREISALRRMLEAQLASLAWNGFARQSPVRASLLRSLLQLGLAAPLAQDLAARVPAGESDPGRAWRKALTALARQLPLTADDPLSNGGVIALVGPTGVGKTTAIARLAARAANLHGPEQVALISADTSRAGAQERLFSFGRLLNVPVYEAASRTEMQQRLARLTHSRIVLVDTAGGAHGEQRCLELSSFSASTGRAVSRWLVLASNAQLEALEESVMLYRRQPLAGIIATKLDEAASLGGLLSVIVRSGLPLYRLSDSPEVEQPLRVPVARDLVKRAVTLLRASPRRTEEEAFAQQVGRLHHALGH